VKRLLERIEIPDEHEARVRAWNVVRSAFDEREHVARSLPVLRPLAAAAAVAALVAAAVSPPGRAVIETVGDAFGVRDAEEALFALPADGRLLVVSDAGAWSVAADGSRRRLGEYEQVTWSPFGRFVAGTRPNELVALEPTGDVRWALPRRNVRSPRWGGSRTDTRIAYLAGSDLRVVAGDGRGDRLLARAVDPVAPAWRPRTSYVLAYATRAAIAVQNAETRRRVWLRAARGVKQLEWSFDGELLLVRQARSLRIYDAAGAVRHELLRPSVAARATAAAFAPDSRRVAFVQQTAGTSHVWIIDDVRSDASAARKLFSGSGAFTALTWSPDGRWLVVAWRDADQWLFLSTVGRRRVTAVANVTDQFGSRRFPTLGGWISDDSS
jgi:hypothetical protein